MHKLILVAVHTGKLAHVVEGIKNTICELEGIDVTQTVLNLGIDDKLSQAENFTHQVESISEARLLTLLGGQCLNRLQIEVVIKVEISQILAVNQQVQHVETLATNLQTSFNPVDRRLLEELGGFKSLHEILLALSLGCALV